MFLSSLIPIGVLISHLLLVFLVLALISKDGWGRGVVEFIGKRGILIGLIISLLAVLGSLYYSNVVGYAPCELCWWQRIFIYPQFILFLTALKFKDLKVFAYSMRLTVLATLISAYQLYATYGGHSFLACTSTGGACTKLFVNAFGYISIPLMSFTVCVYLLLLAFINNIYVKNNSNA